MHIEPIVTLGNLITIVVTVVCMLFVYYVASKRH